MEARSQLNSGVRWPWPSMELGRSSMRDRRPIIAALAFMAGCVAPPRAETPPRDTQVPGTPSATVVESRPVAAASADSGLAEAIARSRSAAGSVDSIVVSPSVIELRVGEVFPRERLIITGRDATGAVVPDFAPRRWLLPNPVASFDAEGIRALGPGTVDILFESPLHSVSPRVATRPRPSTRVQIVVRP